MSLLSSKLSGAISSITGDTGSGPSDTRAIVSKDLRQTLPIAMASPITKTIRQLYSLFLWDYSGERGGQGVGGSKIVKFPEGTGADPAGKRELAEFNFSVPPKVIEITEPFSTQITPTQNGGKLIESQGSILKQIVVQGTTGVRPNTGLTDIFGIQGSGNVLNQVSGVNAQLGNFPAVNQGISLLQGADRLATGFGGLSANEITGHDDIIFLRNIFRLYADLKGKGQGQTIGMVWSNQKDGDYWLVEPKDLKVAQSSNSPLSYNYTLTLTTLARFDAEASSIFDIVSEVRSAKRWLSQVGDFSRDLFVAYTTLNTNLDKLEGLPINLTSLIIAPTAAVINTLQATNVSTRRNKAQLRAQCQALSENVNIALNAVRDATAASNSSLATLTPQNVYERSLRRIFQVSNKILANQLISKTVSDDVLDRQVTLTTAYDKGGTTAAQRIPPITAGDPTYIGNQQIAAGVAQSFVYAGEDIFDLAARLLGDFRLWKSIVVLNQLRSPYVSDTSTEGVLIPGDAVLYPVPVSRGMSSNAISAYQADGNEAINRDRDPLEIAYGRDLRLRSTDTAQRNLTDIEVSQSGDLSTIQGIDNVVQAMRLKFATERGELPAHPNYGARYSLGTKATPTSINQFRIDTRSTILSDPRVKLINNITFVTHGDLLGVQAEITMVDSNSILQASFAVRRF